LCDQSEGQHRVGGGGGDRNGREVACSGAACCFV
jgi:hypothetical protein